MPTQQYWIYKNRKNGESYGHEGNWERVFRSRKPIAWFSETMKIWGDGHDLQPGDIILAQQSDPQPRIIGIVEVVSYTPPCRLQLLSRHKFEPPVTLRPLKQASTKVDSIRALRPGHEASVYYLSPDEAQVLLRAIQAPQEFWPTTEPDSGFAAPEQNREVERAAIKTVKKLFKSSHWSVTSVEQMNLGYDLRARRGDSEAHVEVKGTSGSEAMFFLTANEHQQMLMDKQWQLAVVTHALVDPHVEIYSPREVQKRFSLVPIAYRASPR